MNTGLATMMQEIAGTQRRRYRRKIFLGYGLAAVMVGIAVYGAWGSYRVVSASIVTDPAGRQRLVLIRTRMGIWWDTKVLPAPTIDWGAP